MMASESLPRVIRSVIQVRAEPNDYSEVVSQAIFAEEVLVLTKENGWLNVETVVDGYRGWIREEGICATSSTYTSLWKVSSLWTNRLSAHLYETKDTIYGPIMTLPYGSRLVLMRPFAHSEHRWLHVMLPDGREAYIQRGDAVFNRPLLSIDEMGCLALTFLGLPYTWGGRSSFGYDCSGFVQMLFAARGVSLPRDAKDQARIDGFADASLTELQQGDLVYFGFAEDAIKHVGVSLGGKLFIHTCAVVENAPYVRISSLEDSEWNGSGYYPYRFARRHLSRN